MPAATRPLGEAFDDFEAGLAQSVADGSWLARLLMQILVILREALVRFASGVSPDTAMPAVPEAVVARIADRARSMVAQRVRAASGQVADGLVSVVARVMPVI